MTYRKKLIEVALPLVGINEASAREKSIRHGHPSTLHLWWARRPLAAARAVIFAQMVDDPSSHPELFRTEKAVGKERERLLKIVEDLVKWENTNNEDVLERARAEIWNSWRSTCADNADHPRAKELFDRHKLPAFHDPFAGGGSLPLEAQRLGLEAYASDLNPVAVLINKAMIEIPPKFAGLPPINPEARKNKELIARGWRGAQGMAEDVRYYGKWMRDEAEKRIGHLYPEIEVTSDMAKGRPDLKHDIGRKLTVIAWLWARTVRSPNPAFAGVEVPLASTFMLSTKSGKEAYVEPVIEGRSYRFTVKVGKPKNKEVEDGTKLARGANFKCVMSGAALSPAYIKGEGMAGRMSARMMAIVAEGQNGRVYLPPVPEHETVARKAKPEWEPEAPIPPDKRSMFTPLYGLTHFRHLFTLRQLVALTTFSDLVKEVRERAILDARAAGLANDGKSLDSGGLGARAYADAIAVYSALASSRAADAWSTIVSWRVSVEATRGTFARQALPMVWDYTEANPFSDSCGNWDGACLEWVYKAVNSLPATTPASASQADARVQKLSLEKLVSTDPPYYDNIGYADLSDFFYIWLRRSLRSVLPGVFATLTVPKTEELIAAPYRHGGIDKAQKFFLDGMTEAMHAIAEQAHTGFPVAIYYAFKQSESDGQEATISTGWETFLGAVIKAGLGVTGTWPIRTERGARSRSIDSNALASSIVLVCRPRPADAPTTTRRDFVNQLKAELPKALRDMQRGNIAPVDLAQVAIGPGMAVFTRSKAVLDSAGDPLKVRDALAIINEALDEVLSEQEGDFDADTRWALTWFEQSGFDNGEYGVADVLAKAKNTSINGMVEAGIVKSGGGKVRLLKPVELDADRDPENDRRVTAWEAVHHLVRAMEKGEHEAAAIARKLGSGAETARELAYRLYTICERKKRAAEAFSYNSLVQSWPEIMRIAREGTAPSPAQTELFEGEEA
jgi:putative DNA methylase